MNNIYVSELPKCCEQCKINCLKKQNNVSCFIADCDGCIGGRPKDCPLKLLSTRLAEERKKVVTKIKAQLQLYAMTINDYDKMLEILDQIERGTDEIN